MKIPDGFQKYYPSYVLLWLLPTVYDLIHAAIQFFKKQKNGM